jgi:hypothetical protein
MLRKNISEGQWESFKPWATHRSCQRQTRRLAKYNGLAIHRRVLNRLENFLLYSSFQRVPNQSI